jgi:transcriptional regulator with PAS, ATPase and Fis domain
MYFTFQEVTYIKKLEQNLSQKLRQKGQIARYSFDDIICASKSMDNIIEIAKKIAVTDLTVLITGESGTGKEVLAQAIHNSSSRKNQPFIAINGAAIPDNLLESELFGYVSGSFTGALKAGKKGLFEKANNGTIFLDEIGDMPNHLQSKLLRVLQERQITPIGSDSIIDIDVRVIAATHKDPREMIKTGSFRKDLFYRLNVFPIQLPPLKDRIEDIEELLHYFTESKFQFTSHCIEILKQHDWPGNIRELFNVSQYISTLQTSSIVDSNALPSYLITPLNNSPYEKEKIIIEEKIDFSTAILVLSSIDFLNNIKKTAGRKHLMEIIEKNGDYIEENALKKTITILNSLDFIIIKKGRSGNFITEKGKDFLKKLKQDDK